MKLNIYFEINFSNIKICLSLNFLILFLMLLIDYFLNIFILNVYNS